MNRETALKKAAELVARTLKEFDQLHELIYLDRAIEKNRQKLDKGFINIPFTKYRLFDDLGIIKHNIPAYLDKDFKIVAEYNSTLQAYQASSQQTADQVDNLANSLGIKATGNRYQKMATILVALNITDDEFDKYHLARG